MKLSELVNYYNRLCNCDTAIEQAYSSTQLLLTESSNLSQSKELQNLQQDILDKLKHYEQDFTQFKQQVQNKIREEEKPYLLESYQEYEIINQAKYRCFDMTSSEKLSPETLDQSSLFEQHKKQHLERILNKTLDISPQGAEIINNRILRYTGWHITTMIIHPASQSWMQNIVSNDPLYLVDENYDLLSPTLSLWNETYQHRLRPYVIHEYRDQEILWQLPDGQFGLIVAWNYFDNRPFEVIKKYLKECIKKLRPGGILCMTFNDCDRWEGVLAVESRSALYTPGFLIKSLAQNLGFEIIHEWHENGPWTWIEFKKSGEFTSLRGGQALAKIIPK
jgi:hypothetical protein